MEKITVLVVEDNPDDAELVIIELQTNGFDVNWQRVDTEADYLQCLTPGLDLIISDYNLPGFDGLSAFNLLKQRQMNIPFILVSGTIGEEKAVDCIKAGITDYVLKGRLTRLIPAVTQALENKRLRMENTQMLQDLHRSEARLKSVLTSLSDVIFLIDEAGYFIEVLTGNSGQLINSPETYAGSHVCDILPDAYGKMLHKTIVDSISSDNDHTIEYQIEVQEDILWLEGRISPATLVVNGKRTAVLIERNITHHKNLQNELRSLIQATSYLFNGDSLKLLAQQAVTAVVEIFDQVDCGLLLIDERQQEMRRMARAGLFSVNTTEPLYLNGSGLVPDAIHKKKSIYVPDISQDERYLPHNPDTQSELVVPLWKDTEIIGVLDLQSPHLDAFSLEARRVVKIFAERASFAIGNWLLLEEIKRANNSLELRVEQRTAELKRITEQVEGILNSSKDVIILADAQGIIEQVNPAFEDLFLYPSDEIFSSSLARLTTADASSNFHNKRQLLVETRQMQRLEMTARRADGFTFFADVILSPVFNKENGLDGIICSIRDISLQKQLEIELRSALEKEKELHDLKSRFVSMVSHEYRTPLATIQLTADTLLHYRDRLTDDDHKQRLEKIIRQTHYMTGLMEDVLRIGMANNRALNFKPLMIDIKPLIDELIHDISNNLDHHSIQLLTNVSPHPIFVDPNLIHTILSNLLSNAIKYSPEGGRIDVQIDYLTDTLNLSVKDEGIGIPDPDQARLFELFHRASNVGNIQGTGLGLVIVQQCVEAHLGTITMSSETGVGTTFIIRLPAHRPDPIEE